MCVTLSTEHPNNHTNYEVPGICHLTLRRKFNLTHPPMWQWPQMAQKCQSQQKQSSYKLWKKTPCNDAWENPHVAVFVNRDRFVKKSWLVPKSLSLCNKVFSSLLFLSPCVIKYSLLFSFSLSFPPENFFWICLTLLSYCSVHMFWSFRQKLVFVLFWSNFSPA